MNKYKQHPIELFNTFENFTDSHPVFKNCTRFILRFIMLPTALIMALMILYAFKDVESISDFAEVFQSFSIFMHLLSRKMVYVRHMDSLEELLIARSKFWKYDIMSREDAKKYEKISWTYATFLRFLTVVGVIAACAFVMKPIFADVDLPNPCWYPKEYKFMKYVVYAWETVFYFDAVFSVVFFDGIFLVMCGELQIQFKILTSAVRSIKINDDNEDKVYSRKIENCADHHSFLVRIHKFLNKCYSEFFVWHYLINVSSMCISIFILKDESSDIMQILESFFYFMGIFLQGAAIIIPANTVTEEVERFCLSLYEFKWYNAKIETEKTILFMLMRSQIPLKFTASGFFDVDKPRLFQMPRMAFSICTLMEGMENVQKE